ncbi:hypothetical protein P4133_34705 [Pseudomonas aeruginosa]|nr:hypothetical protein [Pseudomonas aeruginosa]
MPNVLVTFLWRQQRPGDVRLLWPTPEVNTRRFEALAGSDIRYLSLPLRATRGFPTSSAPTCRICNRPIAAPCAWRCRRRHGRTR